MIRRNENEMAEIIAYLMLCTHMPQLSSYKAYDAASSYAGISNGGIETVAMPRIS